MVGFELQAQALLATLKGRYQDLVVGSLSDQIFSCSVVARGIQPQGEHGMDSLHSSALDVLYQNEHELDLFNKIE